MNNDLGGRRKKRRNGEISNKSAESRETDNSKG